MVHEVSAGRLDDVVGNADPDEGHRNPDDSNPVRSKQDPLLGGRGGQAREGNLTDHARGTVRDAVEANPAPTRLRNEARSVGEYDPGHRDDREVQGPVLSRSDDARVDEP